MTTDTIMDSPTENPVALLKQTDSMASWSDDRRKEFKKLFEQRTAAAQCLCLMTASKIANMASSRHFISEHHLSKLVRKFGWQPCGYEYRYHSDFTQLAHEAGREFQELLQIATDRAKTLLAELPPLKKAVQIIDPDTAKMLDEVDRLKKKGAKAQAALEELPRQIEMSTVDQNMTVGEFRKEVATLVKKRKKLIETMNDCGTEAEELEITIAKRLYKGFPGLSDAVMDVLTAHLERNVALDQMQRRVGEQVMFGDSDAATELLRQFEADEAAVSDDLKDKLSAAMATLKKSIKALPKKKAKKKAVKGKK